MAGVLDWNSGPLRKHLDCAMVRERIDRLSPRDREVASRLLLCENGLEVLPDNVASLGNLVLLDLFKNKLVTLPNSLPGLQRLTHLNISDNRTMIVFPECVAGVRTLLSLHMTNCSLKALPQSIGQLKLLVT